MSSKDIYRLHPGCKIEMDDGNKCTLIWLYGNGKTENLFYLHDDINMCFYDGRIESRIDYVPIDEFEKKWGKIRKA